MKLEPANKNSMLYWYEKLKKLDVNIPKTVFVELDRKENPKNECPVKWDNKQVKNAIKEVGGYPCFLRTDMASNKHYMQDSSRIEDEKQIDDHIKDLLLFNEMAGFLGLSYRCLIFREWLNLEHKFKAFLGTPIAKELRFFIKDGQVQCYHFYWPEDAIKFFKDTKEPDNWQGLLKTTREETLLESDTPIQIAKKVADEFEGYWSVDFAKAENGEWYLIDMALGEESWHPECDKKEENNDKHTQSG